MIVPLERYGGPVVLALLVHLLALAGVVYQWSEETMTSHELAAAPMINAKLVMLRPAAPSRKAAAPPPSAEQVTPQELLTPPPEEIVKVPAPLAAASAAAKPASTPPDRAQRDREQQALADALRAETATLAADAGAEAVQSYADRFAQLVGQRWSRPQSARNGMQTMLQIELVPTGEVVRVLVKGSSGDESFDRAAVDAVRQVGRFQVPDGELFERHFRRFLFKFKPEDLLR